MTSDLNSVYLRPREIAWGDFRRIESCADRCLRVGGMTVNVTMPSSDVMYYDTEVSALRPSANLANGVTRFATLSGPHAGYAAGGDMRNFDINTGFSFTTNDIVYRVTYATEVSSSLSIVLQSSTEFNTGVVGGKERGYFMGGRDYNIQAAAFTERMDYAIETLTVIDGVFPTGSSRVPGDMQFIDNLTAVSSETAGYLCGGYDNWGGSGNSVMDRIEKFALDTGASTMLAATLTSRRVHAFGLHTPLVGYIVGGATGTNLNNLGGVNTVDKLDFVTDTISAVPGAVLPLATGFGASISALAGKGYLSGGYLGDHAEESTSQCRSFAYETETWLNIPGASLMMGGRHGLGVVGHTA
jgi:hypothetical protein